jgi:hypothetical protein
MSSQKYLVVFRQLRESRARVKSRKLDSAAGPSRVFPTRIHPKQSMRSCVAAKDHSPPIAVVRCRTQEFRQKSCPLPIKGLDVS